METIVYGQCSDRSSTEGTSEKNDGGEGKKVEIFSRHEDNNERGNKRVRGDCEEVEGEEESWLTGPRKDI